MHASHGQHADQRNNNSAAQNWRGRPQNIRGCLRCCLRADRASYILVRSRSRCHSQRTCRFSDNTTVHTLTQHVSPLHPIANKQRTAKFDIGRGRGYRPQSLFDGRGQPAALLQGQGPCPYANNMRLAAVLP